MKQLFVLVLGNLCKDILKGKVKTRVRHEVKSNVSVGVIFPSECL